MTGLRKVVLSGGPHTGKTTLLGELRHEMPAGTYFVPEPAEILIQEELAKEAAGGSAAILPTTRYSEFVGLVIAKSLDLEQEIPEGTTTAVLDRSLIDNVGYARLNGHDHLVPSIQRHVRAAGYTAALLCDFVGTYRQTAVRAITEAEAHEIHAHVIAAYQESGIPIVNVPPLPLADRVAFVTDAIADF